MTAGPQMQSTAYLVTHNSTVESQLQGRRGLVAGHKKDVVLSERLASLEEHGVIATRPQEDRPDRVEYRLTAKGVDVKPEGPAAYIQRVEAELPKLRAYVHKAGLPVQ